jgi:hypothetical protein
LRGQVEREQLSRVMGNVHESKSDWEKNYRSEEYVIKITECNIDYEN